jgi:hypothetical protein
MLMKELSRFLIMLAKGVEAVNNINNIILFNFPRHDRLTGK